MTEISLQNIGKRFGSVEVLKKINLDIHDAEMIVLVGPSGCGKSTLLRIIAGLEEATEGDILIDNISVGDRSPKERNVAMVFQNYALYPHMRVFDNMAFALRMAKIPQTIVQKKVESAASTLGLGELLDRYPRQLSGGQRQRVAMGRAMVRDPVAFLFDEPLSNLDAKLRVQMRAEIRLLHQTLKTTSVFVTHDQVEAMTMADRIVVMNNGAIEQIGAPLEVYGQPVNSFVAGFIGSPSMNLLKGRMNGKRFLLANGNHISVDTVDSAWQGKEGILGIRPEDLEIIDNDNSVRVSVKVVEHTGTETLVYADIGDTEICLLTKSNENIRPGDTLPVRITPGKVHFFDN